MMNRLFAALTLIIGLMFSVASLAQTAFVVRDMKVEGLQRISEGTVYNYLPVAIGDTMDQQRVEQALRALYGTGLFSDVELRQNGSTLVIAVRERPSIKSFTIEGNKDIETEELEESLRNIGLATGKTFDRAVLENVTQLLTDQYYSRGKYNVVVDAEVEESTDNTVIIAININEGKRARIRQINIVGNEAFTDEELRKVFELSTPNWLSFYRQDDRYARESLLGDLETLRSYYMDRGYAAFEVASTQVAISPDKQDIFITINVEEGEPFVISGVDLAGELIVPKEQLEALVLAKPGQTFSLRMLTQTSDLISYRLGEEGFAFARVEPIPEINEETKEVQVTFYVDPGKRAYVSRIRFRGSEKTKDEVFRREMRQLESAFLSNRAVERSEQRLRRLPFIEEVSVDTQPVPGTDDLVDVDVEITEGQPGSFGGGIGYSGSQGVLLNGNIVHTNFMGTGNRIEADINTSEYTTVYRALYTNPYVTPNGVSRTVSLTYRDVTQFTNGSSDFATTSWTAALEYGYPISEYSRIRFGVAVQSAELSTSNGSSLQQRLWVSQNGNPSQEIIQVPGGLIIFDKTDFYTYELLGGWTYDSRNRSLFADRGARQQLALTTTGYGSEVEFYTIRYEWQKYWPLFGQFTLKNSGQVSWGEDFGSTTELPPYKRFFGGGPDTVRGYQEGRLGPYDTNGNPYGGNLLMANQWDLILPTPEKIAGKARFSLFFDIGNVFSNDNTRFPVINDQGQVVEQDFSFNYDLNELRRSVGASAEWLSPMGVFRFSYGIPLNDEPLDQVEQFQFTIGSQF